ncbi:PhzF family phenazine biosynthesis protein [Pseudonocardia humida]|uniref:PhzF family phenazine biosynthesis protein n=1 Tax=Pseudonocardia humida TaxID=2800819 RepID=A0ABT1A3F8_9PSEU|nr:PhzF family phenazine biosynthesis protein [Pseudonocardia humida]MCO1657534.1 PhzF family phenazine biosynthesis protein [Pseudonocardia humida]
MTALKYEIVDVFTDRAYAGNPLAVVHGGSDLSTEQMQAIANEFNLSETTFVLPPAGPDADYRLRIFTPSVELPFAGHPSVGSAWVLSHAGLIGTGDVVQECGAGLLPVHVDADGARVTGGAPWVGGDLDGAALAAAVGLGPADLDGDVPAGAAGAGVPYAFLPLRPDAVARCDVNPAALRRAFTDAALPGSPGLHVFSFDRARSHAHARMFAPEAGVVEDPATGSASVALAVFLVARGVLPGDGEAAFTVDQGIEMGRPSRMDVTVRAEAGAAVRTTVGGRAALLARGELVALP